MCCYLSPLKLFFFNSSWLLACMAFILAPLYRSRVVIRPPPFLLLLLKPPPTTKYAFFCLTKSFPARPLSRLHQEGEGRGGLDGRGRGMSSEERTGRPDEGGKGESKASHEQRLERESHDERGRFVRHTVVRSSYTYGTFFWWWRRKLFLLKSAATAKQMLLLWRNT